MARVTYHCLGCDDYLPSTVYTPLRFGEVQQGHYHNLCLENYITDNAQYLTEQEIQDLWVELRSAQKQIISGDKK